MWSQLASQVSWAWAIALAVVLLGLRAVARNDALRRDLLVSAYFLLAGAIGAGLAHLFPPGRHPSIGPLLAAASALLVAFGCIRGGAGLAFHVWQRRHGAEAPKILRDVVNGALYVFAAIAVLRATLQVDLGSLLTTSAILSVVVGLALQETLGNLFAGLSLQVERPYQAGDWVSIGPHSGRVVQIAWRATHLETRRREIVTVPNNAIAKEAVVNFSRSSVGIARDVTFGAAYAVPPNRVRAVCLEVVNALPFVRADPPAEVLVRQFADSAVEYRVRYFLSGLVDVDKAHDEVLTRLWYRFEREGIEIPYPQRVVTAKQEVPREIAVRAEAEADALLATVDFLRPLGDDGRRDLARRMRRETYAAAEVVVREGDAGETFYVVASGALEVLVRGAGAALAPLARLGRGDFFGEMSLLTGEPRAATVTAASDCELLRLDRRGFGDVLSAHAEVARELSEMLGRRRAAIEAARTSSAVGAGESQAQAESTRILGRLLEIFRIRGASA